jgi:hypothetical protein
MNRRTFLSGLLVLAANAWAVANTAYAEQTIETEHYTVHYNAFNSTAIAPQSAQENGIVRSKYSALLNIAVFNNEKGKPTTPSTALIQGEARNRLGQVQALRFTSIKEGSAQYYLSEFTFANEEELSFDLTVQPDPNKAAIPLRFKQTFFTD